MRIVLTAALAALALGAGCGMTESRADGHMAEPVAKVATTIVAEKPVGTYITVTGQLTANQRSQVASDGIGRVVATLVERGQAVQAGDPLVQLDARSATLSAAEARAQVEALRAQAERARRDCARAEGLFKESSISQADYERMTAECRSTEAQANAALARQGLAGKAVGDAIVRAPFAGVVDERFVNVGEFVRSGTAVVNMVEVDPMRVQLTVPESQIGQVQAEQGVEFEVSAYPGITFNATIKYLGGAVREKSRDLIVEAVAPNPDKRLRPGMFVAGRIRVGEQSSPVVPASALRIDGTLARIYVVSNGRAEERLVQLGRRNGDDVAVLSGVRKGEKIIAKLTPEMRDGLKVE